MNFCRLVSGILKCWLYPGIIRFGLLLGFILGFSFSAFSQDSTQSENDFRRKLRIISLQFNEEYQRGKAEALEFAGINNLPVKKILKDGSIQELQYIDKMGFPVYHTTFNAGAAATVNTNMLHPGGEPGLDLTGKGFPIGIWDAGVVDSAHREFKGRLLQKNSFDGPDGHATHVAGTMAAEGINSNAKGMAFEAELVSYDWNNYRSEIADEASEGLLISNQSFGIKLGWTRDNGGWEWNGKPDAKSDYRFGFYSERESQALDYIAWSAPDFLMVWSAGNYRTGVGDGTKDPNGPYDCIGPQGVSKNVLTVGAVEKISGVYSGPSDIVMTAFSSWGPADDGRVKPDLVAPGRDLFSTTLGNHYSISSGTSMSAPVVSGSLLLLQELHKNLLDTQMRSSTLKALAIHTAFETGISKGPDYQYGWGMLNTAAAADLIVNNDKPGVFIRELTLENNEKIEFTVYPDGTTDITATIVWTDPPGIPIHPDSLNANNLMLVNDLDITISDQAGTVFFPWILDPDNPDQPATSGDNFRDNIEKILIVDPEPREYTVSISHKGELEGGSQDFSLILTTSVVNDSGFTTLYWIGDGGEWHDPLNWSFSSGGQSANTLPGPDINVVFDENSFLSESNSIIIDQDAYCRSFSWLAKEDHGIDFADGDIFIYGDFFVTTGVFFTEGTGMFVLKGETGIIHTGKNEGVPHSFIFDNDQGNWELLSDIKIDKLILKAGRVNLSGKTLHINSIYAEGELPVYFDLSGAELYLYESFDLTGANLQYSMDETSIIIDLPDESRQVLIKAINQNIYSLKIIQGMLSLEGDMSIGRLVNNSFLTLYGNNNIYELILEEGSETWLAGGSEQKLSGFIINSDSDSFVSISSLSGQPSTILIDEYIKLCFDNLIIYNVIAAGEAVFAAGENSILSGETSGWTDRHCDDVLFVRFIVEYPCSHAYSSFIDLSDGDITSWYWDFGDENSPDDKSDQQNPYHTYQYPGNYLVSLEIEDAFGSIKMEQEIEIRENTLADNEIFLNVFNAFVSTQTAPHYQWYNNGNSIPGATSRTLDASKYSGKISVLISDDKCNRFSNTLLVSTNNVDIYDSGLLLYPNPAGDFIYVEFTGTYVGEVLFEFIDVSGKVIYSFRQDKTTEKLFATVNSALFLSGLYHIRLTAGKDVIVKSIIKN